MVNVCLLIQETNVTIVFAKEVSVVILPKILKVQSAVHDFCITDSSCVAGTCTQDL